MPGSSFFRQKGVFEWRNMISLSLKIADQIAEALDCSGQ